MKSLKIDNYARKKIYSARNLESADRIPHWIPGGWSKIGGPSKAGEASRTLNYVF